MKRISLIFLLLIYTLSSFGIGVRQFYCCGKLKSTKVTFIQTENKKCSKDDGTTDCCKTKFKSIKVKDSHFAADGINIAGKQI